MFLTGFDSKPLNTLYVDKNLKYHGLIQAFSRTNRILNADKPFGNIVCFRNLKQATDQALTLFSNRAEAEKMVLIPSFESIKEKYNTADENENTSRAHGSVYISRKNIKNVEPRNSQGTSVW